jgi:uncharacterized protein
MITIEKRITGFIHQHHVMTLATCRDRSPYCCTCFYVYIDNLNLFVFTSDKDTKHIQDVAEQTSVAGAIALETSVIGKIRGIQFTGVICELGGKELIFARKAYLMKFPVAILKKTPLWGVEPDLLKMTDNRIVFGKKIIWKNQEKN